MVIDRMDFLGLRCYNILIILLAKYFMDIKLEQQIKDFLKNEFVDPIRKKLGKGLKLKEFNINPFISVSLSNGMYGVLSSENIAKSLLYPRVFGTSINTTFGDKMQKLCTNYLGAEASGVAGMDIEFIDKIDNKKVIAQLKAGPNTINSGDVELIIKYMRSANRLLTQNRVQEIPTFAVCVAYGSLSNISSHYKNIAKENVGAQPNIPIYIGKDFWHRLTGNENFYNELLVLFIDAFKEEDCSEVFRNNLISLGNEIESKYFANGYFDSNSF